MLSIQEQLFAENLISALGYLRVKTVPFGDDDFNSGMRELSDFIEDMEIDPELRKRIKSLFLRTPISGDYDRMIEAFQMLNGRRISFTAQNPTFMRATINTSPEIALHIIKKNDLGIPFDAMISAAKNFCKGADIRF